jgi:hypothetical protein
MRLWTFAPFFAATFAAAGLSASVARADQVPRISDPAVHDNLAIYFIRGASAPGPVPLTLKEAVEKGQVIVSETGQVNELMIENTSASEVFIQAGDLVKGGKQDRVLMVSLVLPPKSGKLPIASFCVEHGRWTSRGSEDVSRFHSAAEAMPSRSALLAMAAPPSTSETTASQPARQGRTTLAGIAPSNDTAAKQRKVWDDVAKTQEKLKSNLGAAVAAPQSATSLQLSLENERLKKARGDYVTALKSAGEADADIIGYVVAINGQMASANVYPSNGLFRKMWDKQLAASVTEAIGEKAKDAKPVAAPAAAVAQEFLQTMEKGASQERPILADLKQETREGEKGLYNETKRADGRWVYRNYLAK